MKILKRFLRYCLPASIIIELERRKQIATEHKNLYKISNRQCSCERLRPISEIDIQNIFINTKSSMEWAEFQSALANFNIPDGTGGINPGDRKAIFHLIGEFNPQKILEIGTHIGASTTHIAYSMISSTDESNTNSKSFVSLDIVDVNDPQLRPWLEYGTQLSPKQMIAALNCSHFVEFRKGTSLDYLQNIDERFDLIFLDGDHSAETVYRELPASIDRLNSNGIILLHDYFPEAKPLWSNGIVIPGPFLAVDRLKKEGCNIDVLPFGKLPWPTKLDSHFSSLAIIGKK